MPKIKPFGKSSRKRLSTNRLIAERRERMYGGSRDTRSTLEERPDSSDQQICNLETTNNTTNEETEPFQISGRRVIEIGYFIKQLQEIGNHKSMFSCNLSTVELLNEKRTGLNSTFYMKCQMCGTKFVLKSSHDTQKKMDVNEEVVAGIMTIGAGITQINTVLCHINIPPISARLYQNKHDTISRWWKKTAHHSMAEAGKEEKCHAIRIGSINNIGVPMIPVSGDGCWSKRSYGTNYSASSGVGAIVGMHSKKVLFYGVKNKTCSICSRANSKGVQTPTHTCYKNFDGPSSAMEAVIITEGFKKSIQSHGLIYSQYIADGDSSTYASIRNARPYDNVTVGKIECKNHLLRNYCKGLLSISSNTTYHIRARKLIKENYLRIRWGIDSSIKYWTTKDITFEEKAKMIKNDIINGPYHVFGDHSKCATYFCTNNMKRNENIVPELSAYGVFQKIEDLAYRLSLNAYSFVYNETNNTVESFNARVAKFVGGKRVNFTQRGSYLARCAAAVVSYNTGTLQSAVHKFIFDAEANPEIVKLEEIRRKINKRRMERNVRKKKTVRSTIYKKDAYYGESCQKVDMEEEQFKEAKEIFLKALKLSETEKNKLEKDTMLQSGSPLWLETRRKLLTASWFATVCKRRPTTECGPLITRILYGKDLSNVPSIKHGRTNEQTAIRDLENALNMNIQQCGLFIDQEFPFLGASPDGKCELGIVEVKCPSSAYDMEPDDAISQKKVDFWLPMIDNTLKINKKHKWFYQIQGQLRITGQDRCVFAIWTGPGKLKIEIIEKDSQFWKEKMETHLIRFYKNCLLPELIDPRRARNMELRAHSSHIPGNILNMRN